MKTEHFSMDSKAINDADTQINSKKTVDNFPLSFLDFLNSKTPDKTTAKNVDGDEQYKGLKTQGYLGNDTKHTGSSLVDKETLSTNIWDNSQSEGLMTRACLEKDTENTSISSVDEETSDVDVTTFSEDEDFLPTYRNLFERIKRHSSQDNLFKLSPGKAGKAVPDSKLESTLYDNGHTSVSPAKFESLNRPTTEAFLSVGKLISKTDTNGDQSENQRAKQYDNKDNHHHQPVAEQPPSLVSHVLQSDGGRNERPEAPETLPEMQLADLERICYKAMIFQQTGQIPMDCDGDTTESHASCEEGDPTPKNPCPCLCRFYCKKKCKKDQARLSPKGPCRIGKGYASDKRNCRNSSCACKILPTSKISKQVFQTMVGESSNTKSAGVIEENNCPTVDKTLLRQQKRARKIVEPSTKEENAKKYLDDQLARSRLFAKLELSEKRLKRWANPDASLPFFSGIVAVDEDRIRDESVLSLSDDDSVDEQKENISDLPKTHNVGPIIDLTADSPPKPRMLADSHQLNKTIAKSKLEIAIKADPEKEMLCQTNKKHKPTVGRYGVAMGAIYISDGSDECDLLNDHEKDQDISCVLSESSPKLSKEPLENLRRSIYIWDSDEDSRPDVLFKSPVPTTSQSMKSPTTSESGASDWIDASKEHRLYRPVTPGLEDNLSVPEKYSKTNSASSISYLPVTFTDTNNVSASVLNDGASTSHSVLDWTAPSHGHGATYENLLAAYDSDDDHMSFTLGSPANPEYLDNEEDTSLLINVETLESEDENSVLEIDDVVTSQPSTSAVPDGIVFGSERVLRVRTTPRITQTMLAAKKHVKRETISPSIPQTPVNNSSASGQSIRKQRGRPRKTSCPQESPVDNAVKKAKVAVVIGSANENNESTPERALLKREITAMASKLKKVSALAARAAELEKVALDARHKELLAEQKAQQVSEELKLAQLDHMKLLKETQKMNQIENAKKKKKSKELEKEKERAASEARAKSWECPVCFEPKSASTQLSVTPCGHVFCKMCIMEVGHSNGHCPLCNHAFTATQVTPLFFNFPF